MNAEILVIGSINVDLIVRAPRVPRAGETLFGERFQVAMGGKGANQAMAVSRLGGSVEFVGCVGNDEFGRMARESLEQGGIDVRRVRRESSAGTGVALIIVDSGGDNSIVVAPGANMMVRAEEAEAALRESSGAKVLLLQLEIPMDVVLRSARRAGELGMTVVLDAGPAAACPPELFAVVDIISPNETETESLLGRPVDTIDKARRAAADLLKLGPRGAVIKLGERGCLVAQGDEFVHLPAHRVDVVDTTAAGDVFTGALALAVSRGESLVEAARFGNAAAALAVTRLGAQPSIPVRSEVDSFLATGAAR